METVAKETPGIRRTNPIVAWRKKDFTGGYYLNSEAVDELECFPPPEEAGFCTSRSLRNISSGISRGAPCEALTSSCLPSGLGIDCGCGDASRMEPRCGVGLAGASDWAEASAGLFCVCCKTSESAFLSSERCAPLGIAFLAPGRRFESDIGGSGGVLGVERGELGGGRVSTGGDERLPCAC